MSDATQGVAQRSASGRWVSLARACEILGADESTLRRWADAGRLRVYRTPGGHRRFSLSDLESMVAGDNRHRGAGEVERLAVAKIRRQLQRARQEDHGWYGSLSDISRQRLRDLGRRLVEMAGEYMDKRTRRASLLDEALEIGGEYGRVLIEAGLPLPSAVGAYIGFRKTIDETTNQAALRESMPVDEALAASGQVHALGDQVLLGMTAAYESLSDGVGR
ncbi:MAG TPA: helix-turn-helix domain-containing protein [Dehalococcoidia bacterium]|nr:helix-turn-helix domain-containing protein [Dehalococcoidia bacterium]